MAAAPAPRRPPAAGGAATARGARRLEPLPGEAIGPPSARAGGGDRGGAAAQLGPLVRGEAALDGPLSGGGGGGDGGGRPASSSQATGALAGKPVVLGPLDRTALAREPGAPSRGASDPAGQGCAPAEGGAPGSARPGRLEPLLDASSAAPPLPAGFGVAAAALPEPARAGGLERRAPSSARPRPWPRGLGGSARLRQTFDAQMAQHQAAPAAVLGRGEAREAPAEAPATPRGGPRGAEGAAAERARCAREEAELAGAVGALRKAGPGCWDAPCFVRWRQRLASQGMPGAVRALDAQAAMSSRAALDTGAYRGPGSSSSSSSCQVRLPTRSAFRWVDCRGLGDAPASGEGPAPPLVVSAASACEAGLELRRRCPHVQLFMSFEATDYTPGGEALAGADAARPFQQEMLLRTTLELAVRSASKQLTEPSTLRGRLTAKAAPAVLAATGVVIFREGADKGYQFLPQAEQASCTVLVSGRCAERPLMAPHGERFAREEDAVGCVDRLQAVGLATLALASAGGLGSGGELAGGRPFLVIAAQGLTDHAGPQPRDSIARLLQTWRRLYAGLFEAVVVACGSPDTAAKLDVEINADVYARAVDGVLARGSFAWRPSVCSLSVSPVMRSLAEQMGGGELAPAGQAGRAHGPRAAPGHRLGATGAEAPLLGPPPPGEAPGWHGAGPRAGSLGRIALLESSMQGVASSGRGGSSVWVRDREQRIRQREEEEALWSAQRSGGSSDSRSVVARMKRSRLGGAFEREYEDSFRDPDAPAREAPEAPRMSVASAAYAMMVSTGEQGHRREANAAALSMPKEVLREVVRAEGRMAVQQTPASLKAEEALRQMQRFAGGIGERLQAGRDESSTTERRLPSVPGSPFRWG